METKFDLILLFSGGYDSSLLLKIALAMKLRPLCLIIDYHQIHDEELKYAEKFCLANQVHIQKMYIDLPASSNLLEDKKTYEGVNIHHVPSRNLIFVSMAASIAESRDIPLIWYGANYEDREKIFPDCYQEWVFKLNELLTINGSSKIKVEAPLLGMSKDMIKDLAKIFNINPEEIYSGYGE